MSKFLIFRYSDGKYYKGNGVFTSNMREAIHYSNADEMPKFIGNQIVGGKSLGITVIENDDYNGSMGI